MLALPTSALFVFDSGVQVGIDVFERVSRYLVATIASPYMDWLQDQRLASAEAP
jgi:hypothetical protein